MHEINVIKPIYCPLIFVWNCIPNEFVRTYYILNCMCFGNSACSLKKVSEMRNPKIKLNAGPCINVESIWRYLRTFRLLQPTPSKKKNISQFFWSCCATEQKTPNHILWPLFLFPFAPFRFTRSKTSESSFRQHFRRKLVK